MKNMVERKSKKIQIESPLEPKKIKCVFVGESGCGKSTLIKRFCNDFFDKSSKLSTVGSDFYSKTVPNPSLSS